MPPRTVRRRFVGGNNEQQLLNNRHLSNRFPSHFPSHIFSYDLTRSSLSLFPLTPHIIIRSCRYPSAASASEDGRDEKRRDQTDLSQTAIPGHMTT